MKTVFVSLGLIAEVVAVGLAIHGINLMYDNSYFQRVVGGDAYNFIIYATRGTAYVVSGVVSALIGIFFVVVSLNYPALSIEPVEAKSSNDP